MRGEEAWRGVDTYLTVVLVVAGVVAGAVVLVLGLVFALLVVGTGAWRGNSAKRQLDPLTARITELPARFACAHGDGGTGLDNVLPWYEAHDVAESSAGLPVRLADVARAFGFEPAAKDGDGRPDDDGHRIATFRSDDLKLRVGLKPGGTFRCGACSFRRSYQGVTLEPGQCLVTVALSLPARFAANRSARDAYLDQFRE